MSPKPISRDYIRENRLLGNLFREIDYWAFLLLSIQRQADFETRFAGLGFEFNFSSVTIADDAIADDESKPSAGPDGLGREKRLEEMRLQIRRNAGAVIHDLNDKLVVFEGGANANFSGAVGRVDGVVDEIGPDLIEFSAVGHDG